MKGIRLFFVFTVILGVMEAFYFYPLISDRIAVHFNALGVADGWGPKQHFFATFGLIFNLIALLFWALPLLVRRVPESLINLPNKDYWLAPERKKQTLDRLSEQMLLTGCMALLFMDGILYLVIKTNLSATPALPTEWMWGLIAAFIAANVIWLISLLRKFRRPKG